MSTFADVASDLATAIEALSTRFRLTSDYRTDRQSVNQGVTMYQIRTAAAGKQTTGNSNVSYDVAAMELSVHHKLGTPENERAYTEGQMVTDLASVMWEKWWRDLASVYEVVDPPEVAIDRIGKVISYTVSATVLVKP